MTALVWPPKPIKGRLRDTLTLADPPGEDNGARPLQLAASRYGILAQWPNTLALHDQTDGRLLARWPEETANKALSLPPVLDAKLPLVLSAEARELLWFDPGRLQPQQHTALADIKAAELDAASLCAKGVWAGRNGTAWLLLTDTSEKKRLVELDASGVLLRQYPWERETPRQVVPLSNTLVVATDTGLFHGSGEGVAWKAMELDFVPARLWPSPEGRFMLATQEGPRFALMEETGEGVFTLRLQGLRVGAEAWLFYDHSLPEKYPEPLALQHPVCCWEENSRFAVLGDESGIAALIDPHHPRATKIMVAPGKPCCPLTVLAPDSLRIGAGKEAGRLELDWAFSPTPVKAELPNPPPSVPGRQGDTEANANMARLTRNYALWIILGLGALGTLLYLLAR